MRAEEGGGETLVVGGGEGEERTGDAALVGGGRGGWCCWRGPGIVPPLLPLLLPPPYKKLSRSSPPVEDDGLTGYGGGDGGVNAEALPRTPPSPAPLQMRESMWLFPLLPCAGPLEGDAILCEVNGVDKGGAGREALREVEV